jgi:hypothetical protein
MPHNRRTIPDEEFKEMWKEEAVVHFPQGKRKCMITDYQNFLSLGLEPRLNTEYGNLRYDAYFLSSWIPNTPSHDIGDI